MSDKPSSGPSGHLGKTDHQPEREPCPHPHHSSSSSSSSITPSGASSRGESGKYQMGAGSKGGHGGSPATGLGGARIEGRSITSLLTQEGSSIRGTIPHHWCICICICLQDHHPPLVK